jgi:1,2-diacylglycerol 3-beta-glucosyltransferase
MNCGLFIRREVFEVVGKFDPYTLVDDFDLGLRMRKRGLGVRFVPGPKCGIQYALTLRDMFGQHRRWYTGGIREIQEEIRQGRYLYILVLVGAGVAMLFPLIVISLGYVFPSGALRHTVLPVALSTLYSAALSGYLLQTHPGLREAPLGALLGIPAMYLFTLGAMLVSLVSAQRQGTWYKVKRERA